MDHTEFLAETKLFEGSTPEEIKSMLECLDARERRFKEGARIYRMGDTIKTVGLVLEGCVRIENVDVWGNVNVLGTMEVGDAFGAAYAAVPDEPLMVDVVAAKDSRVLFVKLSKVLTTCPGQLCAMYLHSPTTAPREALLCPYLAREETEAQ